MFKAFKKFFDWLFGKHPSRHLVTPLEEELVKKDKQVRELSKKLQSYDAQLSKISAEKEREKEKGREGEEDEIIIGELKRQRKEIETKKMGDVVSFRKIYLQLFKNKKYKNIEVVDRDDKTVLGYFKDFVVLPTNGMIGLQNTEDRIMSYGPTLRQVIYKPESLANQFRRKRILLPCNENYEFIPDIEEIEMPECIYDPYKGKIKWARIRKKPLKDMIKEREEIIKEKEDYVEKIEQDKVDLVRDTRDLKRALKVQKNISENSQSELSMAMDKSIQFEQKIGELQMRVIQLQEVKNINEKLISSLERINEELLEQTEEMGTQTEFRRALTTVKNTIDWARDKIPREVRVIEGRPLEEVRK